MASKKFSSGKPPENLKHKHKKSSPDSLKHCNLYVDGMHCASCEILIEKKLLKQEGVEFVDATQTSGQVVVKYKQDKPDIEKLNQEFEKLGYKFSDQKTHVKKTKPLFSVNKDGSIGVNPTRLKSALVTLLVVLLLIMGYFWLENSGVAPDYLTELNSRSPISLFVGLGLFAGITSCAALVGGLLLSMTKQWNEAYIASDSILDRSQPHIMFHIGRLFAFFVLGGVLGAIFPTIATALGIDSEKVFQSKEYATAAKLIVSLIMLILGLQMLEVRWASKIRVGLPKFISRFASKDDVQGRYTPFLTGMLTFFVPCGFTLLAQGIALSSGDFARGATIMSAFAIGTMPVLLGISISSIGFNYKPHFTAKFNQVVGLFILFIALSTLFNFISSTLFVASAPEAISEAVEVTPEGTQTITIVTAGADYTPQGSTTIQAGIPTKLRVINQGAVGCYAFMTGDGLFDGFVSLKPGENIIEFTPNKTGRYWIDCAMYMVDRPVPIDVI